MIKALFCKPQLHTFHELNDFEQVSDLIEDPDNTVWLDLLSPGLDELQMIAKEFDFHPLAIEDASHSHQRPKADEYENFFFVVFYVVELDANSQTLIIKELNMFLGKNYLVTIHSQPIAELDEAEKRWKRNVTQIQGGPGILLYSLLDAVVDHYFPIVDTMVDQAEVMEDEIFQGKAGDAALTERLLGLKKQLLRFRRIVSPERDVLNTLTNRDSPIFSEHTIIYFRDVYDHLIRLADTLDLYRDQLSSTMDANLSVTSNQLNKVMRTLTSCSIMLMSAALVPAIYGMNFVNIPELKLDFGYYGALALMSGIISGLYLLFKRIKWL